MTQSQSFADLSDLVIDTIPIKSWQVPSLPCHVKQHLISLMLFSANKNYDHMK